MSSLFDKLDAMEARYRELADLLAQPEIAVDYERVQTLAKESAGLEGTVNLYRELRKLRNRQEEAQAIVDAGDDSELVALAREEMDALAQQVEPLEEQLRLAVLPKDPNDERNVIVEIRKGAGGQEAACVNFSCKLIRTEGDGDVGYGVIETVHPCGSEL